MANGIQSTFAGNVTRDVQLQHTQSGIAVANVDVAIAHRVKVGEKQWEDGETTYVQCTVWRELAEHCAESLSKGTPVVITGLVFEEKWERGDRSGIQKKCEVEEIGVSLRWGTADYHRRAGDGSRGGRSGGFGTPAEGQPSQGSTGAQNGDDPWTRSVGDEKPWCPR